MYRLEIYLKFADFLSGGVEPLLQLLIGGFLFLSGLHQAFDNRAQAFAVFRTAEFLGHFGKVLL